MHFSHYTKAFTIANMPTVLFSQLLARLPEGILALAILVHVEQTYRGFTAGGSAVAVFAVAKAISGPLGGRALALFSPRKFLAFTIILCSLCLCAIALLRLNLPWLLLLVFLAGLSTPPILPTVRTLYPQMTSGQRLQSVFIIDASIQEVIWIIGPLIAIFSASFSTQSGILVSAVFLFFSGLWFLSCKPVKSIQLPKPRKRLGAILTSPVLITILFISFFIIGAWGGLEVAAVAQYSHKDPYVGFVLALAAFGSLIGGFVVGMLRITKYLLIACVLISLVGFAFAVLYIDNKALLWVFVLLAGAATAPIIAISNAYITMTIRLSDSTEAYGWIATSQLVGASIASALAGFFADASGPKISMFVGFVFVCATLVVAVIGLRFLPHIASKNLTQRLDTQQVPIVKG